MFGPMDRMLLYSFLMASGLQGSHLSKGLLVFFLFVMGNFK